MASKYRSTPKQPPGPRGRAGLSFSERLALLTVFVDRYQTSLATEGGSVLSARVRLAIAHAARQALLSSSSSSCEEECHSKLLLSGRDACLRAGTTNNIHQLLSGQERYHSVAPELAQALTNDNDALIVTGLIHAILNHQSRLDKTWYEATMQDLDQTTIIPPAITGDARQFFLQTLFCELVLVTTMAHSMHCLYLAIGQDPPALPELRPQEEGGRQQAEEPYWFDWTRALTSSNAAAASAGLYYDGKAWAPYLPRFAVDTRSLEFAKIPGMAQDSLATFFRWRGLAPVPYVAMTYAVADFIWFMHWFELAYVSQMRFFQPFRPLDGTKHCSGSVSRQDLEIVATAVAAAHQCTF
jgi:hypothetical protein